MKRAAPKPELQHWYRDRYQAVALQRKLLAFVTLAALGAAFAMALIVTQLLPLKSIEPYVIQIDPRSGVTQAVNPVTAGELTANEAVNNYFIVQYIRAREGYNPTETLYNYNLVRLMSESGKVYGRFRTEIDPNNPNSNVTRLGTQGQRTVKIKSITYIGDKVAQVRIQITERAEGAGGVKVQELHRIALISFDYVRMTLSSEERYANPLGFRVTDYQLNEDAA